MDRRSFLAAFGAAIAAVASAFTGAGVSGSTSAGITYEGVVSDLDTGISMRFVEQFNSSLLRPGRFDVIYGHHIEPDSVLKVD